MRRLLGGLSIACLLLLLLEGIARWIDPPDPRFVHGLDVFQPVGGLDEQEVNDIVEGDANLFWKMKKNLRGRRWLPPLWRDTRSNALGFRDNEFPRKKPAGEFRILCLGDSCTYGSGVPLGDSYPQLLEGLLASVDPTRAYEVINAGFPGYTCFQGYQLLLGTGLDLDPDVVVASFGLNETGTWSGSTDVETHARMNAKGTKWLLRSAVVRLLAQPFFRAERVKRPETAANESSPRMTPELYVQTLQHMIDLVEARGIHLVLLLHPTRPLQQTPSEVPEDQLPEGFDLQHFQHTSERMQAMRVALRGLALSSTTPLLDLEEPFRDKPNHFIDNCHLNRQGCLLQAQLLFQLLQREKLVPEPPD